MEKNRRRPRDRDCTSAIQETGARDGLNIHQINAMIMLRNLRPEVERISRSLTLLNPDGLQALPASEFVSCVLLFKSTVTIHSKGRQYPADRILEVLLADLNGGDTFVLEAEGPDARKAVERICRLRMFRPHVDKTGIAKASKAPLGSSRSGALTGPPAD